MQRGEPGLRDPRRLGEPRREHHPHGDGLPVRPARIRVDPLERVAQCVAVVQDQARPLVALVGGDGLGLGPDAPRDEILEDPGIAGPDPLDASLQRLQDGRVDRQPVLRHLGQPGPVLAVRKRRQRPDVREHHDRLVERPDQVLALGQIHRRLAADGGVDLRGERRRDLQDGEPAHVGGRHEPGQVSHHAAAQRHQHVAAVHLLVRQLPVQHLGDLQRLRLLTLRDGQGDHGEARPGQRGSERFEIQPGHHLVGHHERLLRAGERREMGVGLLQEAGADHDVVGPALDRNGHGDHRTTSSTALATALGSPSASTTRSATRRYVSSRCT